MDNNSKKKHLYKLQMLVFQNKKFVSTSEFFIFQIKQLWKELPLEGGVLDYQKLVRIMKRGNEEEWEGSRERKRN